MLGKNNDHSEKEGSKKKKLSKRPPQAESLPPKWSIDEDARLIMIGEKMNLEPNWAKVLKQFPGKTASLCQERYEELLKKDGKKGNWLPEEDEILRKWVKFVGYSGQAARSGRMDRLCLQNKRSEWQTVPRTLGQYS